MKKLQRLLMCSLALGLMVSGAEAQTLYAPPPDAVPYPGQPYPPPPYPQPYQGQPGASPVAPAPIYAPQQLDQMLAPIALYPDPLLAQILTAATYPMELDQAAQWRAAPGNAMLTGQPLAATLQAYDWDPSVKSLIPFPQTLSMMDQHLDWTEAVGRAFLAQQADVMDSVQRLRRDALNAGTLVSSPYASVIVDGPYISIEPTAPQTVYVPVYDPGVYGAWPNPGYPPIYYGPPPGLAPRYVAGGIGFAAGIVVVDVLWRWGHPDWHRHALDIDANRFNRINVGRPPVHATTWHHEPDRRDVAAPRPTPPRHDANFAPPPAPTGAQAPRHDEQHRPPQAQRPAPPAAPQAQRPVPPAAPQAQPRAPGAPAEAHDPAHTWHGNRPDGREAALPPAAAPVHAPPQAPAQFHAQPQAPAQPPHPPAPPHAQGQAAAQPQPQQAAPPQAHPQPAPPAAKPPPHPPRGDDRQDEHHP